MKNLIKVQEALKAPKSQFNSFGKYNYRNQEDILESLKPLLAEHELLLTLTDEVKEINNIVFIEATATITNGKESITVKAQAGININKKGMDIAQTFGSSSSYARKYALNAMFLIDDTKDADNQDNSEPVKTQAPAQQQPQVSTEQAIEAVVKLNNATTIEELTTVWKEVLTREERLHTDVIAEKNKLKTKLK